MNAETKAKRDHLKNLSKIAKMAINTGATDAANVNEYLIEFYTDNINEEFHTFHDWKKLGYKVKKGSKAFLIWGKPPKKEEEQDDEDDSKFFPLCYMFSNAQVEKIGD